MHSDIKNLKNSSIAIYEGCLSDEKHKRPIDMPIDDGKNLLNRFNTMGFDEISQPVSPSHNDHNHNFQQYKHASRLAVRPPSAQLVT
jgi:hypothetical protein